MAILALDSPSVLLLTGLLLTWILYTTYSSIELERKRKILRLQYGCQPQPPNARRWDVFGFYGLYVLLTAAKNHRMLEFFDDNYKLYGPTHGGVRRGREFVTTMDAENIKCLLATKIDDWAVEPSRSAFHPFLGKGIFTTDGAYWSHSRSVLRPQFEKHQVSDISQFEPHVQRLFANIPTDGSTVDLQALFHSLTMDTSSEFLTGTSTNLLDTNYNHEGHEFANSFELGTQDGTLRARLGLMYWLFPHSKANQAIKTARAYAERWVNEALKHRQTEKTKSQKGQYVFLNELAADERVDAERIRDELLNILLAGRDTTASLLASLFYVLVRQPEIYKKLQAEVDELHGELPSYERLRDMKYIRFCAQETLRLYPPVPALIKEAVKDTVLPIGGGPERKDPLFMAKGSLLFYNVYSMMRSEAIYGSDATTFRPERWADSSLRPGWNYLPFGGGARVCLGQQYALTEAYYVTIRLLQEFRRIERRDDKPWQEKLTATLCSLHGTQVALYK